MLTSYPLSNKLHFSKALIILVTPIPPPTLGMKSYDKNWSSSFITLCFPNLSKIIYAYYPSEMVKNISLIYYLSVDLSAEPMVSYPPKITSIFSEISPIIFMFQKGLVYIGKFLSR